MAAPKSEGRMIRKDISRSHKVAGLSPKALALFGMLLPHYNVHGKMDANPHTVKGTIVPFIDWFDIPTITKCLHEISEKTNVKYFQVDGCWYLHSLNYDEHQEIRRKGRDYLPSYPGPVQEKSGSSTGKVPPEVEPEVEVEPEPEVEPERDQKLSSPDKSGPPPPNGFSPDDMARLWNEGIEFFEKEGPVLIPKVLKLTPDRKKKAAARIRDCQINELKWKRIIDIIHHSPFLSGEKPGKGHEDWKADFDFTIKSESTLTKILEGGYT